ncbi:RHS repeat protein [Burkholderia diffusa]|uniref:YD repeat-containing protein n=1 Tax=Burkholderia diffusa TaxID=488732 RepID=A0A6P2QWQ5_9BURK|nr:RHS repeat protein [Burkholderia diffusa]KAB0657275.1 hypothetical protein F7R23_11495 [Burkholderia diffusa]MBM2654869.1 hypothetical protein [Burkholderia diffusa]VWC23806.1 YD repeat-containing protein [Burkholderia diffusa]
MDSTNSNAAVPRAKQVAVVPVNLIQPADVGQSISAVDDWPIGITDASGKTKQLEYNSSGQLTRYVDCSAKASTWAYDARGQLVQFTDAAGQVTRYRHEAGQLAAIRYPDDTEEHFERDAEGRLLTHIDALGRRTEWDYTEAGLLAKRVDAAGQSLRYQWDKLCQLTALRNENGRDAEFHYDPVGRLLTETGFDGAITRYEYEEATGKLARAIDGQRITAYTFDDPIGLLGVYNLYAYVRNAPTMRSDPLGLQELGAFFNSPGIQERVSLGTWMHQQDKSLEEISMAMNPQPAPPIMTGECRVSGTLAMGTGVSIGAAANEVSGVSGTLTVPMMAVGARATATCGFKFGDPKAKTLPAAAGVGFGLGVVTIDITQTSTWPEVYIGVGPGIGPEAKMPATPGLVVPLF